MLQLDALAKVPKYGLVVFTETYGGRALLKIKSSLFAI